jgi:hypothetical protein
MYSIKHFGKYFICKISTVSYTEEITGEHQGGFRLGSSTIDQIFYCETNIGKKLGTEYRCI